MPQQIDENLPTKFPNPQYLTLENFKRGVITLIDKSRLPKDALEEANNIFLAEDGQPTVRPGTDWYGTAPSASAIDGFDYFDFAGVIHLVAVAGGVVYRSTNDGLTWTACTGVALTSGLTCYFNQYNNLLYITNGTDSMTLYDGTTVLTQYTALSTPAAPTIVETGLAGTGNQYYYKCSAVNTIGFSVASAASAVVQATLARESWDATTNFATLTLPALQATQTRYDIYVSEDNLNFYYLDSTATVTYVDTGTAIASPSTVAPTAGTSQGPKVAELTNVGSRMYGVRDTDNRYRIWFSSGQTPKGAFSSAYDGGYLDWQSGGKYMPVKVADYRDGKGTPLATIWCKSADGQGCILQMSLDTLTVGDISITVPSAYKLPGSRGTPAPDSVVNVLNDFMFYNQQAFYNLGSRAQFLNLLSTDESSANIRPTVKQISQAGESKIASAYYDAKVFFSVPFGSTTNNYTIVYDTERKAWLPKAFTLGFSKFLRYTDTTGVSHLLALKPRDTRLSEISSAIQGDYGAAFATSLTTGLYPTTRNRFEFQFTEEAEVEFSNPQGTISVELIGIERSQGFSSIKSQSITVGGTPYGWDSFLWDSTLWDDTTLVSDPFSESTVKRYWPILKELNAVQWRITTNSLDAAYVLRTLQTWGTDTQGGKPRTWLIS
jgi:hypothetical protein